MQLHKEKLIIRGASPIKIYHTSKLKPCSLIFQMAYHRLKFMRARVLIDV
jgi:hypothetical protein